MDIENLQIEIQANANDAASGIDKLSNTLTKLKTAANIPGLKAASSSIAALASATKTLNQTDSGKISSIASAIDSLTKIQRGDLGYLVSQIKKIPEAFNALTGVNTESVGKIVLALKPLENLQKTNLGSTITQLRKLSDTMKTFNNLSDEDLAKFTSRVRQLASALIPLANEMQKVSNGFNAFPAKLQRAFAATSKAQSSVGNAWGGVTGHAISWQVLYGYAKRLATGLAECVTQSNKYVEDLNLFTVAMGDYAEAALDYANKASDALGIDPAEFMRNQGIIQQIVSGFGVAGQSAATMSKNMAQLGYDISSFFNIPVADAMTKLESGIAGELEPLRRIGYALDQATLQQIAYSQGINQSVQQMNQAEKAHLRYIAIMQQSGNVMYDMGRTIMSPANAMRVMQAQIVQLKRAIGDMLIPALTAILPYAIAVVQVLTMAAKSIAAFFGFKLPTIDYSSVDAASVAIGSVGAVADDVSDRVGGIGKAASDAGKKIRKDLLLTFDELNVVNEDGEIGKSPSGGSGGGAGGGVGDAFKDIELPDYNFLDFASDELKKRIAEVKKEMEKWLPIIKLVAVALAALFATKFIFKFLNALGGVSDAFKKGFKGNLEGIKRLQAGIMGFVASAVIAATAAYALVKNGFDPLASGAIAAVAAFALIGPALYIALGPIGLVVAAIGAVIGAVTGVVLAQEQLQKEATLAAFFDSEGIAISLYADRVEALSNKYVAGVQPILDWGEAIKGNTASIQSTWAEIDVLISRMNFASETITSDDIVQLKSAFNSLYEKIKENVELSANIIVTALNSAFKQAVIDAGVNVDELIGEVYRLKSEIEGKASEINANLQSKLDELAGYDPGSTAYISCMEDINKLAVSYGELTGTVDVAQSAWNDAKSSFDSTKIDFTDVDSAKDAMGRMGESANGALNALDDAKIASLHAIDTLQLQAKALGDYDPQLFTKMRDAVTADYNSKKDSITSEFQGISNEVWSGFQTNFGAAFDANMANASWGDKIQAWLVSRSGFGTYEEVLATIVYDGTKKSLGEVSGAITDFNTVTGTEGMTAIGQNLMTTLGGAISRDKGVPTSKMGTALDEMISVARTKMQIHSPSKLFDDFGALDMQGLGNGISNNAKIPVNAMQNAMSILDASIRNYWGISGGTAQKMVIYASVLLQSLSNGITQNIFLVINALTRMFTDMQGLFTAKKPILVSEMKSIMSELKNSVEQNSDFTGSIDTALDDMATTIHNNTSVSSAFNSFFNCILDKMDTFTARFRDAVNDMLQNWRLAMNSININATTGKMTYSTMPPIVIPRFAGGGFPDMGTLFVAGERGPELVASVGGRSVVGNGGQVEGALERIFGSTTANGTPSGDDEITAHLVVNLDGQKIYENQQRISRDRGVKVSDSPYSNLY